MGRIWQEHLFFQREFRRGVALALSLCLLVSLLPLGAALGSSPSSIIPSSVKVYVKLGADTKLFTATEYTDGVTETTTVGAGTVLQLVANQTYTVGEKQYYCLYYNSQAYNVRAEDITTSNILSADQLLDYIKNTLWKASSYSSLRRDMELKGDVRVHGLQLALQILGYYSGDLDGGFGSATEAAVWAFQKANKLDRDGRAGPLTQAALYPMALLANTGTSGGTGGGTGTTGSTGTLKTTDSVNLRKGHSTSTARLAVVPRKVSLTYFDTYVSGGVMWFKVVYNNLTGWLMGTFVNASGGSSGGGSGSGSTTQIGTLTITQPGTRVRKTPNGEKTGTVLAKGSVVPLLADRVEAGGYGWYKIQTGSGIVGYVRHDCSSATLGGGGGSGGGSGGVTPSTNKTYFKTSGGLTIFTTKEKPTEGLISVPDDLVLQLVSPTPYTVTTGGTEYCSVYYGNKEYNAVYADVKEKILKPEDLQKYLTETIWKSGYTYSLKLESNHVGDVRVHAAQLALSVLGYYTGALDGNYGSGSASATRNFQRKNGLDVDGSVGPKTWAKLFPMALAAYTGYVPGTPGTPAGDFGVVKSVEKATWATVDGGAISLFKQGSTATVMDVETKKVFTVYRWSGGYHADCVPYSAADTKIMCDIVGFPYNSKAPSSSQLSQIKGDTGNNNARYTWPDFDNAWGDGAKDIGGAWDRRAALLNVDGRVFCVSIYGWPHGFNGTDAFSLSRFPNGTLFYVQNNYYGMMCVHFVNSKTHTGGAVDSAHQAAIDTAYNYAKTQWPTLMK